MSEPTPDDKIARLVHLVLEAVDQRLEGLRQELQQIHHRLGEVEKSVARVPSSGGSVAAGPDPRVDRLTDEIRSIRNQLETLAARPQAAAPTKQATSADMISPVTPSPVSPLASSPARGSVDTSLPTLQPLLPGTPRPLAPTDHTDSAPRPVEPAATTGEHSELIDLDRLNDLLTVKLGQLNLPRPT